MRCRWNQLVRAGFGGASDRRAPARAGLCLLLLAAAGGCTPTFENSTTIKDLRIIAVRADPPEFLVDLPAVMQNPALLGELPTFQLTPLVLDPHGAGREVHYQVQACGNRPGERARGADNGPGRVVDSIAQAPCGDGALPVASGTAVADAEGRVPIQVTFRPTLELLAQAVMDDPLSLELGLPITVSFTVRAGDEQVVVVKRVLFSPQLSADQVPNRNPEITHLSYRLGRNDEPTTLQAETPPSVSLGGNLRFLPAPAEAEPYRARAFSRDERTFITEEVPEETLRYAFYATQGTFSPGGASTFPSPLRNDPINLIETTYNAPVEPPADGSTQVFIYVVVRDERGGASFIRGRLLLGTSGPTAERTAP
jgi:hypothetical protein